MCSENFWFFEGQRFLSIQDRFEDPLDLKEATMGLWPWGTELPGGKPYDIVAYWEFEKYFLMDKIQ